jgi:beta-phosphoglucomutase-like phosphatase (HAD superfamily)
MVEPHHLELDTVADDWQSALDAAGHALADSDRAYSDPERGRRRRELSRECMETEAQLARLAREEHLPYLPWLSAGQVRPAELGLPAETRACVFDLDGVLTNSAAVHAAAWAAVFDDLLLRLAQRLDRQFVPFDRASDYAAYLDGRPRLDGIHEFLRSRGIGLPEGHPGDRADAETVYGLAQHKGEVLARIMRRRGINALPGARRYLEAAGRAHLLRAVVSGSATVPPMLELAGLDSLVETIVDATDIREGGLRVRPAPDLLLAACHDLQVEPRATVSFAHDPAGVAAARTAGIAVIGVSMDERSREALFGFGAQRTISGLSALLERRLRADAVQ